MSGEPLERERPGGRGGQEDGLPPGPPACPAPSNNLHHPATLPCSLLSREAPCPGLMSGFQGSKTWSALDTPLSVPTPSPRGFPFTSSDGFPRACQGRAGFFQAQSSPSQFSGTVPFDTSYGAQVRASPQKEGGSPGERKTWCGGPHRREGEAALREGGFAPG